MRSIRLKPPGALFASLFLVLGACATLRTEFYREETSHRYTHACKSYRQGAYAAAREQFLQVIGLDPEYGAAHAALGNLALIGEDYLQALNHYRAALAADPGLEAGLRPFIMTAEAHRRRDPLRQADVGLNDVYPLLMEERLMELEALLLRGVPLRLLAEDTMGLTPGMLGDLQRKAAEIADLDHGGARLRLFLGCLIFNGQSDDALAAAVIEKAAIQATGTDRTEAFLVLGLLYERLGQPNLAVDAYLAAVGAGRPLTEVAHHLARLYRTDIAAILPAAAAPPGAGPQANPVQIVFRTVVSAHPLSDLGTSSVSIPDDAEKTQMAGNAF
jgi:Tfp pilus assembly protein PilF